MLTPVAAVRAVAAVSPYKHKQSQISHHQQSHQQQQQHYAVRGVYEYEFLCQHLGQKVSDSDSEFQSQEPTLCCGLVLHLILLYMCVYEICNCMLTTSHSVERRYCNKCLLVDYIRVNEIFLLMITIVIIIIITNGITGLYCYL